MNGSLESIRSLISELLNHSSISTNKQIAVFPPAIYLPLISDLLKGSNIAWGAQNVYPKESGAFTGEISGRMLKDYGCQYVLVGHSERRKLFGETGKIVKEKYHHVKEHGMIPVLCVGETLEERNSGQTLDVIKRQIESVGCEKEDIFARSVIAYEPVWAIGTGQTPEPIEIQKVHAEIRSFLTKLSQEAADTPVIYGGSVTSKNAKAFFEMPDVNGALVGGASLNALEFLDIVKCIN